MKTKAIVNCTDKINGATGGLSTSEIGSCTSISTGRRAASGTFSLQRQRGVILLLVIVAITLLALMGAAYLQVARVQREKTTTAHGCMPCEIQAILKQIKQTIQSDIGGNQEVYDYPWTGGGNWDGNNKNTFSGFYGNYPKGGVAKGNSGDDAWLASSAPTSNGNRWQHLTNLNGLYLEYNSSSNDFLLSSKYSGIPQQLSITGTNNISAGKTSDSNQNINSTQLIDVDGDGIADSRWTWGAIPQIGPVKYTMAVRIIDLSSKINVNTVTSLINSSMKYDQSQNGADAPRWDTPSEIDMGRFSKWLTGSLNPVSDIINYRWGSSLPANPVSHENRWNIWKEQARYLKDSNGYKVYDSNSGTKNEYELLRRNGLSQNVNAHKGIGDPNIDLVSPIESGTSIQNLLRANDTSNYNENNYEDFVNSYGSYYSPNPSVSGNDIKKYFQIEPRHQISTLGGAFLYAPPVQDHNKTPKFSTSHYKVNINKALDNGASGMETIGKRMYSAVDEIWVQPQYGHFAMPWPFIDGTRIRGQYKNSQLGALLAVTLKDYADSDSLITRFTGKVDGDSYSSHPIYGMEYLPFIDEVYGQRKYKSTIVEKHRNRTGKRTRKQTRERERTRKRKGERSKTRDGQRTGTRTSTTTRTRTSTRHWIDGYDDENGHHDGHWSDWSDWSDWSTGDWSDPSDWDWGDWDLENWSDYWNSWGNWTYIDSWGDWSPPKWNDNDAWSDWGSGSWSSWGSWNWGSWGSYKDGGSGGEADKKKVTNVDSTDKNKFDGDVNQGSTNTYNPVPTPDSIDIDDGTSLTYSNDNIDTENTVKTETQTVTKTETATEQGTQTKTQSGTQVETQTQTQTATQTETKTESEKGYLVQWNKDGNSSYVIEIRNPFNAPLNLDNIRINIKIDNNNNYIGDSLADLVSGTDLATNHNDIYSNPAGGGSASVTCKPNQLGPHEVILLYANLDGSGHDSVYGLTDKDSGYTYYDINITHKSGADVLFNNDKDINVELYAKTESGDGAPLDNDEAVKYDSITTHGFTDKYDLGASDIKDKDHKPDPIDYTYWQYDRSGDGRGLNMLALSSDLFTNPKFDDDSRKPSKEHEFETGLSKLGKVDKDNTSHNSDLDNQQLILANRWNPGDQLSRTNRPLISVGELMNLNWLAPTATSTIPESWQYVVNEGDLKAKFDKTAGIKNFLLNFDPLKAVIDYSGNDERKVTAGMDIMSQFTTLNIDDDKDIVPGLININTMPQYLLKKVLPIPDDTLRENVAKWIVDYRAGSAKERSSLATGSDSSDNQFRSKKGISRISELAPVFKYQLDTDDKDTQEFDGTRVDFINNHLKNTSGSIQDGIKDDYEQASMLTRMLSSITTVRSDYFAAYVLVRGYKDGFNSTNVINEKRFIAIFKRGKDRANIQALLPSGGEDPYFVK